MPFDSEPIAILGTSITLPANIHSRERFFEIIKAKNQVTVDTVKAGRYHQSDIDLEGSGHPWKIKSPYAMFFTKEEADNFDMHFFNMTGKVARNMHAEKLWVLQSVFEALEDAGLPLQSIYKTRTGVFVAGYVPFVPINDGPDETVLRGQLMSSMADQVSYFLGTHGPSLTLETACSSSLVCMGMAVAALQAGDCDTAIVTGMNSMVAKDFHLSLQACGVLVDGPASHPFCEEGPHGFMRCEGVGTVILRRMTDAEKNGDRVLARILKAMAASAGPSESAQDGPGRVYEQPSGFGMKEMFERAYDSARLKLEDLDYMECHATGTQVGDVIELQAIGDFFKDSHDLATRPLRVASVKSNIGHAEIAAGMFSVIKIVEMMQRRVFLPTAGVRTPRRDFDWESHNMKLQSECEPFPEDRLVTCGVNSFGIGGAYGHVVIQEYKKPAALVAAAARDKALLSGPQGTTPVTHHILALSAKSQEHLTLYAERMATYLMNHQEVDLKNLCGTMAVHRSKFQFCKSFVADTLPSMIEELTKFTETTAKITPSAEGVRTKVAFVFTGQGSQWQHVGQSLLGFPVYRKAVQEVDRIFRTKAGWSILEKLNQLTADEMRDTLYAQPITFLVQVGLYELLKSFRVFPDVVMGHSAGEVSAAYAAGLLTLEEAVEVVFHRSAEQQKLAGSGRMLAVGLSEEEIKEYIKDIADVEIACVNSPSSVVLASSEETLQRLKLALPEGTQVAFIPGNIAFHSSRTEPVLESMKKRLAFLNKHQHVDSFSMPLISTVTGKLLTKADADYWAENVRRPVLFKKAIETMFAWDSPPEVVIEIGPHRTLVGPFSQTLSALSKQALVIPTLMRKQQCSFKMLETLGLLVERGLPVDLAKYYSDLGFEFEARMPKHPWIKKPLMEMVPYTHVDTSFGVYKAGPIAGRQRAFDGAFMVEACDRTFKTMTEHVMGARPIFPGMFFVEMCVEAHGSLPLTLTNVEFKSMLPIPKSSAGQTSAVVSLNISPEDKSSKQRNFVIRSTPTREKNGEPNIFTEHMTGAYAEVDLLDADGKIKPGFKAGAFGLLFEHSVMKDLGVEGLAALKAKHTQQLYKTEDAFYGHIVEEGRTEFGPTFRRVKGVSVDPVNTTFLAKMEFDTEAWEKQGGVYGVQLLDGMLHVSGLLIIQRGNVFAGGYEAGHYLRKPKTSEVYSFMVPDTRRLQIGHKKKVGDFLLYDGEGNLCVYIRGYYALVGSVENLFQICTTHWQPLLASSTAEKGAKADVEAVLATLTAFSQEWSQEDNAKVDAYVAKRIRDAGLLKESPVAPAPATAVAKGTSVPSLLPRSASAVSVSKAAVTSSIFDLVRKYLEVEGNAALVDGLQGVPEFPRGAKVSKGLDKVMDGLIQAMTIADAKNPQEILDNLLTTEEVEKLTSYSLLENVEAASIASTLVARMAATQKSLGHTYVMRVLELVEGNSTLVLDALSGMILPEDVNVEYFVASKKGQLIKSLALRPSRKGDNIRSRFVLLGAKLATEIKDVVFDTLVVNDWATKGTEAWAALEGKDTPATLSMVSYVSSHLAPRAQVFVRGFSHQPMWLEVASQASSSPLTVEKPFSELQLAAREFVCQFTAFGEIAPVSLGGDVTILAGQFLHGLETEPGQYLVVADNTDAAEHLRREMQERAPASRVDVVYVGVAGGLGDDFTSQQYAEAFLPYLKAADDEEAVAGLADAGAGAEESKTGEGGPRSLLPLKGVVFMASVDDKTNLGELGFSRLMKVGQALVELDDAIRDSRPKATERLPLWVITSGVYVGTLQPRQGTLQGFVEVMASELTNVVTKHIDLSSPINDLAAVSELVIVDAREMAYVVVAGDIKVKRYNAVDKEKSRSMQVLPNDPNVTFVAALDSGNKALNSQLMTEPGKMHVLYVTEPLPALGEEDVQIDIYAAAMNFRDVMIALNLLPEKSYDRSYYGRQLGLEASGVITAVGKKVKNVKVGDRVMCGEPKSFTNRLIAPANRVVPIDPKVSFEDAAAIQSVYNTSHHALVNLARVRRGERVLIHSAAGGIGHSAISICKHLGAVIYATTSSSKREAVAALGVDPANIYDSRSTSWFDELMRDTNGEGVDVVLNALAGKHQQLGIQALRSSGRFCEIGKVDIYDNSALGLLAFRKNISFFAVDMDRLALDDPEQSAEVAREVGRHFQRGEYHRLPICTFPMNELRQALDFMKTGKHIGKVVLTNYTKDETTGKYTPLPVTVEKPQNIFHDDVTYLVTGGAGGFGAVLVRYAWLSGAKHFLITTRSTDIEKTRSIFSNITEKPGCTVTVVTCDTAKEEDVRSLVATAKTMPYPVKAIFHLAGVSVDVKLPELTMEDFHEVADCKALGAWYLSEMTKDMALENFVVVSSVASVVGGLGMASYSSANAFMDCLIRYRQSLGLPGATFNMGSLSDVGILVNNLAARKFQAKCGIATMYALPAAAELENGIMSGLSQIITMFYKEETRSMFPGQAHWTHELVKTLIMGQMDAASVAMSPKEIAAFLAAEVKSITKAEDVLVSDQLAALGLDSFGFVELAGRIKKSFGIEANAVKMSPDMTIMDMAQTIYKLQRRNAEAEGNTDSSVEQQEEEELTLHSKADLGRMIISKFEEEPIARRKSQALYGAPLTKVLLSALQADTRKTAKLVFGATGLTGAHMVRYLIKGGATKVYCIVRSATEDGALRRVIQQMRKVKLWKDAFLDNLVCLAGDISQENFGLSSQNYDRLLAEVDQVVMAAGTKNWAYDVEQVACNVTGLMNIVALARKNGSSVHFISTGWLDVDDVASPEDREIMKVMPYLSIKRRAEGFLHFAARHYKVAAYIYRLPLVGVNTKGGFSGSLVTFTTMQLAYEAGMLPDKLVASSYPIAPADILAKWVVRNMNRSSNKGGGQAHIISASAFAEHVTTTELLEWIHEIDGTFVNPHGDEEEYLQILKENTPGGEGLAVQTYEFFGAISRSSDALRVKLMQGKMPIRLMVEKKLHFRSKVSAIQLLKQYTCEHPELYMGHGPEGSDHSSDSGSVTGSSASTSTTSPSQDEVSSSPQAVATA